MRKYADNYWKVKYFYCKWCVLSNKIFAFINIYSEKC